jgi:hypothetical protein
MNHDARSFIEASKELRAVGSWSAYSAKENAELPLHVTVMGYEV